MIKFEEIRLKSFVKRWFWVILGIVCVLLEMLLAQTPELAERFYSRGIFPIIRSVFDYTLAFFPFPLIYFFYATIVYFAVKLLKFVFNKNLNKRTRWLESIHSILSFFGFLLFNFFFLWGFNYARLPFSQQLGIKIQKPDTVSIRQELEIAAQEAISARAKCTNSPLSISQIPDDFEQKMRENVSKMLNEKGFPANGRLRGRSLSPDGILFRFGIAGIYMPFVGESNIDNGLHDLEKPFSMAHEMAHGYGWTDEATANFVAYLSCIESENAFVQYSGYLNYYRYVAGSYKRQNPDAYKAFRDQLPVGMVADLEAINQRLLQYEVWFSTDWMNDIYLRSLGVKEGVVSYSRVVVLVYSWRRKTQ